MNFIVENASLTEVKTDLVVVNLFEGVKVPSGGTGAVDHYLSGLISDFVIGKEIFDGKFGNMYLLRVANVETFSKVLIVGLGKFEDFTLNKVRELSSKVILKCKMMTVFQPSQKQRRKCQMDDINSLTDSKWRCKYHIVFEPKYRRQEILIGNFPVSHTLRLFLSANV